MAGIRKAACMILLTGFVMVVGPAWAAEAQVPDTPIIVLFDQGWACLGQMHKDPASLDRAVDAYNKVLAMDPDNEDAYWKLAEVTFKMADEADTEERQEELYEKTRDYAEKSLELNPDSLEARYWIGCSRLRLAELAGIFGALGHVSAGKEELHKTIEMDPDHRFSVLARAVLAAVYTESPWPMRDLDKAQELAEQAVVMDPSLTIAWEKLARVYARQDKPDKARETIEKGLAVSEPTYVWDFVLYDRPAMEELQQELVGD